MVSLQKSSEILFNLKIDMFEIFPGFSLNFPQKYGRFV